ncbi:MAG: dephospho-CoA kinase [Candidatus Cloacimonadaceae bacterium]|jgi:dephospho-CoA kinase
MDYKDPNRPIIIGVTGNIGSGKTVFCNALERYGQKVFYTDMLTREVLSYPEVMNAITQRWGDRILENGQFSQRKLGDIVFASPEDLGYLNSIVHPGILLKMQAIIEKNWELPSIVFEIPLLFEASLQEGFDYIVLVTSSPQLRGMRLQYRDRMHPDEIQLRIDSQMPDKDKHSMSDLIVRNEGTIEDLFQEALKLVTVIPNISKRDIKKPTQLYRPYI